MSEDFTRASLVTFRKEFLAQVERDLVTEWAAKRVLRRFKPLASLPDAPPEFHLLAIQWAMPQGYPAPKPFKTNE